jgi:hypothetical protein
MVIHIVIAVLVVVLLALLYAAYKVHFVLPYLAIRPSRMKVEDLVKRFGTPNVAELYGLQPERVSLPMRDGCMDTSFPGRTGHRDNSTWYSQLQRNGGTANSEVSGIRIQRGGV